MRLITLGWTDADWDTDTEKRMVNLVKSVLTDELTLLKSVPPDTVEFIPAFTAEEIAEILGVGEEPS